MNSFIYYPEDVLRVNLLCLVSTRTLRRWQTQHVRPRPGEQILRTHLTCPTCSPGHNGGSKSEFWISIKLLTKLSQSGGGLIFFCWTKTLFYNHLPQSISFCNSSGLGPQNLGMKRQRYGHGALNRCFRVYLINRG